LPLLAETSSSHDFVGLLWEASERNRLHRPSIALLRSTPSAQTAPCLYSVSARV
jgi:hypothetical protein